MEKVLVSVPDQLAARMRATFPPRQRSRIIAHLLEKEVQKREKKLYECALEIEKDASLKDEMSAWDTTLLDGLHDESW